MPCDDSSTCSRNCDCDPIAEPKGSESPSDGHGPCRCGHIAFRHQRFEEADTHCDHPSCSCTAYAKRQEGDTTIETVELPEPPMTPEEEEEACETGDMRTCTTACPVHGMPGEEAPEGMTLPPPKGPEYTPCVCGHIEPEHAPSKCECWADDCECPAYRTERPCSEVEGCDGNCCAKAPPPPQPDRRPPYAVAYSVQGHLYEVALPGDATIRAVDGALVIQHALGPVAGITRVVPVVNGESA